MHFFKQIKRKLRFTHSRVDAGCIEQHCKVVRLRRHRQLKELLRAGPFTERRRAPLRHASPRPHFQGEIEAHVRPEPHTEDRRSPRHPFAPAIRRRLGEGPAPCSQPAEPRPHARTIRRPRRGAPSPGKIAHRRSWPRKDRDRAQALSCIRSQLPMALSAPQHASPRDACAPASLGSSSMALALLSNMLAMVAGSFFVRNE